MGAMKRLPGRGGVERYAQTTQLATFPAGDAARNPWPGLCGLIERFYSQAPHSPLARSGSSGMLRIYLLQQ